MLQVAVVAVVSPFAVRLKGATSGSTPVRHFPVAVPAGLAVGDRVAVAVIDRQVWFFGRGT